MDFDLEDACIAAMDRLAAGPRFALESDFQVALARELGWRRELNYGTRALANKGKMKVDLGLVQGGELVAAIELKYVTDPPGDPPALPYDVAKDCLKLELLLDRAHGGELCWPDAEDVAGDLRVCVIALTNIRSYWDPQAANSSGQWSRHFAVRLCGEVPQFSGLIKVEASNTRNTIYSGKRAHMDFGLTWQGRWRSYSHGFRYLLMKRGRPSPQLVRVLAV